MPCVDYCGCHCVKELKTIQLVFTAWLRPQVRMPPVRRSVVRIHGMMRMQHFLIRTSLSSTAAARRHAASTDAARYDRRVVARMANFKMYLIRQFCSNQVEIFLQYTADTDAKNDGPEFWNSNAVIFEFFLNFQKRVAQSLCSWSGPLWSWPN